MSEKNKQNDIKVIATNRKAYHDYFIEETIEAGIELKGTEVKSVRLGHVNLKDSFARVENGEVFLYNMHISPYEKGNIFNVDPMRDRKLLLHKHEINRLAGYVQQKGYTLIPLKIYIKRGKIKVELAVAKGKKLYDKREAIAKRDAELEIRKKMKEYLR
ncbi:SsrA-binding protein [Caldicellulosiruptor bescii]|jgi:SsrA-binding protein|uniref:SsrA-binding protein n=2 Tax=Caldicellulosiruptor bescii TaxID=31899 RepID=SSRP_CALBD|nr:SsrA-binding protein SmpB [Caldicellulosiruptor bescii]B9MNR6.1 RecName: Full=SsrA-binding protein; AltName: Full=Small protein B [Caldicellulosiruptor bescii DSM 6725]ACM59595.1 SsrA-binding protein [Caldicellulosiruptor bescii DSM 6725]PBC89622.1 SsrA-binding protein [Caldicellulosiruptor bescii]PBC89945.1 SsrA-binding protein [Caldicellulosiruptor bescii]PBD04626.1 SsrA-binding protein [Caldicellulosiruptor bescii]PBD05742.1 SsrA-binding protein [Caldicellulosiruptor bescii]